MTPEHAKKLYRALSDNLSKYEKSHGKIKETDQISNSIKFWRSNNSGLENCFLNALKGHTSLV